MIQLGSYLWTSTNLQSHLESSCKKKKPTTNVTSKKSTLHKKRPKLLSQSCLFPPKIQSRLSNLKI